MLSTIALDTQVIRKGLCTSCGACIQGCPTGCLKAVFFPNIPEGVDSEDLMS